MRTIIASVLIYGVWFARQKFDFILSGKSLDLVIGILMVIGLMLCIKQDFYEIEN